MYLSTPRSLALALPFSLVAGGAFADLTPADVWGDWKQYMEGMGYTVTATQSSDGGDLAFTDLNLSMPGVEGAGAVTMSLGSMQFVQQSGGTVAIVLPAEMPLSFSGTGGVDEAENFTANMIFSQSGTSYIVSGTPEEITYDMNATNFAFKLDQLIVGDETFGAENARIDVQGTNLQSSTTMTKGDLRDYNQTGQISGMTYDVYINNPAETAQVALKGGVQDITMQGGGAIPLLMQNASDMGGMLKAGFDVVGSFTYGSGNTEMTVTDPVNGNFNAMTSTQGGSLGVEMSAAGLTYSGTQQNLDMTVNVEDLPFPISFSMEQGGFNLSAPVTKSEDTQDFAFGLTLGNFVMSNMIWGIFDPTGQLPRDPATLELDVSGKAKLDVDYLDPEAAAAMGVGGPGEVQAVTINKLLLDAAGAKLEGSGDVTLDNSDYQTLPGMPKPVGEVNLALAGGNALIDKLVAMGLLPQDQAMGARMMMGLFAVPGSSPDTLTSKIEFTDDGQILANGQRIK